MPQCIEEAVGKTQSQHMLPSRTYSNVSSCLNMTLGKLVEQTRRTAFGATEIAKVEAGTICEGAAFAGLFMQLQLQ